METKRCGICEESKPLSEYSPHPKALQGVYPNCRVCRAAISRDYYYKNRTRLLAQQRANPNKKARERKRSLRRKYKMTVEDYERLYEAQQGRCRICGRFETLLHVDHDHESGLVRCLLCKQCNLGLGHFRDDPALLFEAAFYVSEFFGARRAS